MAQRGRPKGSKNKTPAKQKPGPIEAKEDRKDFFCVSCGKHYKQQERNFSRSFSPLFAANDGYAPICKNCVNVYYDQLIEYFDGNEDKAIERVAQIMDWYFSEEIWAATKKIPASQSRVNAYPARMQLQHWQKLGTSYLDTIRERGTTVISDYEEFEEMRSEGDTSVTKAQIARWGLGFEQNEYQQLDNHYKSLRDIIDTNDVVQDNLAKDLCEIKIQQIRARSKGDADMFQKFTKLYQDTLKSANLKVRSGDMNNITNDEACWGNFIRDVEKFAPADIYMDKKLFSDVDSIKEYMTRFVLRPIRNFFGNTRDMDQEFSIGVGDGEND